jgi:hypothetical protein
VRVIAELAEHPGGEDHTQAGLAGVGGTPRPLVDLVGDPVVLQRHLQLGAPRGAEADVEPVPGVNHGQHGDLAVELERDLPHTGAPHTFQAAIGVQDQKNPRVPWGSVSPFTRVTTLPLGAP